MKISPITDSTELQISGDVLRLSKVDTVLSTPSKDVPDTNGLKWWLDYYPAGRRSNTGSKADNLFRIYIRVSHMPVKCSVKYSIADYTGTTNVICSTVFDEYVFSVNKDVLISKTSDAGLIFKSEVTFTDVPKAVLHVPQESRTPPETQSTMSRTFTDIIDFEMRLNDFDPDYRKQFRSPQRPISEDRMLFWWLSSEVSRKPNRLNMCIQTSASACNLTMTYSNTAGKRLDFQQETITTPNFNAPCDFSIHCTTKKGLPLRKGVLVVRCIASFTFLDPIKIYKSEFKFPDIEKVYGIPNEWYQQSLPQPSVTPVMPVGTRPSPSMPVPNRPLLPFPMMSPLFRHPVTPVVPFQTHPQPYTESISQSSTPLSEICFSESATHKLSESEQPSDIEYETPQEGTSSDENGYDTAPEDVSDIRNISTEEFVKASADMIAMCTVTDTMDADCSQSSDDDDSSDDVSGTALEEVSIIRCITSKKVVTNPSDSNITGINQDTTFIDADCLQSSDDDDSSDDEDLSDEQLLAHRLQMQNEETLLVYRLLSEQSGNYCCKK